MRSSSCPEAAAGVGAATGAGAGTGAARQAEKRRRRAARARPRRPGENTEETEGAGTVPPPLETLEESASRGGIGEGSLPSLERHVQTELETPSGRDHAVGLAESRVDFGKPRDEAVDAP